MNGDFPKAPSMKIFWEADEDKKILILENENKN